MVYTKLFQCKLLLQTEKKAIKVTADEDKALLAKSSLDLHLVEEHSDDLRLAKLIKYEAVKCKLLIVLWIIYA